MSARSMTYQTVATPYLRDVRTANACETRFHPDALRRRRRTFVGVEHDAEQMRGEGKGECATVRECLTCEVWKEYLGRVGRF